MGLKNSFKIFGSNKSIVGSIAYLLTTFVITLVLRSYSKEFAALNHEVIMLLPVILTSVEALSVYGLDNLTVPMAIYLLSLV